MKSLMKPIDILVAILFATFLCVFVYYAHQKQSMFNCQLLIGGWHPDAPKKYLELCDEAKKERSDR